MQKRCKYIFWNSSWIQTFRTWLIKKDKQDTEKKLESAVSYRENPYLSHLREILEQILAQRSISYGEFSPVLLDGSDSQKTLAAARAISEDLNHLKILTDVPAYFMDFAAIMYEEQGLIVEIVSKKDTIKSFSRTRELWGNVILDFEQPTEANGLYIFVDSIYIPIFKTSWEIVRGQEGFGNLDIAVPIGYNTVIVSIGAAKQKCPDMDKFERAFWL